MWKLIAGVLKVSAAFAMVSVCVSADEVIVQSARDIPVTHRVDVLVVGANEGGIGAALSAAAEGASVMIVSAGSWFGHEITSTGRYWLDADAQLTPDEKKVFGPLAVDGNYAFIHPLQHKQGVEAALVSAGIKLLHWSHAVDVIVADDDAAVWGVVVANKAGRQCIEAKSVIDATPMAGLARIAGARMTPWPSDTPVNLSWTLYLSSLVGKTIGNYQEAKKDFLFTGGSWPERCEAESRLRQEFDRADAAWGAYSMDMVEPIAIEAEMPETATSYPGPDALNLACTKPMNTDNLYVIGSAIAVERSIAEDVVEPLNLFRLGKRLGKSIAAEAAGKTLPAGLKVKTVQGGTAVESGAEVRELLTGSRLYQNYPTIPQARSELPVWGSFDVVVAGGGTGGAPAGIGAARAGANVLVIERSGMLGGVVVNSIGRDYGGPNTGFTREYSRPDGVRAAPPRDFSNWLFQELTVAGGKVWFNTTVTGVVNRGNKVLGLVVSSPQGRGIVLCKNAVDGTGDGDLCAWAGAEFTYMNDDDLYIQNSHHTGDSPIPSGYNNGNETPFSPTDMLGQSYYFVHYHRQLNPEKIFDIYPLALLRESRRVWGERTIGIGDIAVRRTFSDCIGLGDGKFDMHGVMYTSHERMIGQVPAKRTVQIPLRSILPESIEGILIAGKSISVSHDALAFVRGQPTLENLGFAAGYTAAVSAKSGTPVRNLDLKPIQQYLFDMGNLDDYGVDMNSFVDMPEFTDEQLRYAAENTEEPYDEITKGEVSHGVILLQAEERSIPIIKDVFSTNPTARLAQILCLLGDTSEAAYLAQYVEQQPLGGGCSGWDVARCPDIDGYLYALGYTGCESVVPVLTKKLSECGDHRDFSHIRYICLGLSKIRSPEAVPALKEYLLRSNATGHSIGFDALEGEIGETEHGSYYRSLTEIMVAGALYRSGDAENIGRDILLTYLNDWRSILYRFAGFYLYGESGQTSITPSRQSGNHEIDRASADALNLAFHGNKLVLVTSANYEATMPYRITVSDLKGRTVGTWSGTMSNGRAVVNFERANANQLQFANGAYLVQVRVGNKRMGEMLTGIR